MLIERDVDTGEIYRHKRHKLMALAGTLTDEQLGTIVPATPAWSVHDVVSHLVGITSDLNALRFGDGDADDWTAAQVATRRGRSISELGEEWEREAERFEPGLLLLGYEMGSHYVGDLLLHTQDVRSALGAGRIVDDGSLAVALDFYLGELDRALRRADVGSVAVRIADDGWTVGSGPLVATLGASRFALFRSLGGRRSETQIRALDWTGDVERVLPHMSSYPLPVTDLFDP